MLDVSDLGGERKATPEELAKLFCSVPAELVSENETPPPQTASEDSFIAGAGFGRLSATAWRIVEVRILA